MFCVMLYIVDSFHTSAVKGTFKGLNTTAFMTLYFFILNILFCLFCVIYLRNPCDIFSLCWSDLKWLEIKIVFKNYCVQVSFVFV